MAKQLKPHFCVHDKAARSWKVITDQCFAAGLALSIIDLRDLKCLAHGPSVYVGSGVFQGGVMTSWLSTEA